MKKLKLTDIAPYSGKRVQPFEGFKRYMSTGDLKGDSLSFEDVTFQGKPSRADITVTEGDILFAKMANTNKAIQITKEHDGIIVSTGFSVHRPIENILSGDYFLQYLKHDDFLRQKNKLCTGAIQSAISNTGIEKILVPVPDYPIQLKIAKILKKVERLITQRQQSITLLDKFLKSTFLEMFGDPERNEKDWSKSELKAFTKVRIGPFGSLLHREDYVQNGVPLVNPTHISEGKIIIDTKLTISKDKMKDLSAYVMHEGDVVLGRRGEIGRCAVVTENEEGFLCGTGSIFIRPTKALNPIFLYNVISSSSIRKVLENSAKGITMKNLNSGIIENLKIPVPPLALQNKFAQIVEKTEVLKAQYQSSLQELENLYASLSQRAFKGELTLNKAEEPALMAAEPEAGFGKGKVIGMQPKTCSSPEKAILAGHIIYLTNKEDFGRVKLQKLLHLTEYNCKIDIGSNFVKNVAGPHDGQLMEEIESTLKRFYFYDIKQSYEGNHKVNYTPLSSVRELEELFKSKFKSESERIDTFLAKFKISKWDQCEIISTLYAVWNNRLIKKEEVTDDLLKEDFLHWDAKKIKYKDRLDGALQWMKDKEVIPDGWGKLIK